MDDIVLSLCYILDMTKEDFDRILDRARDWPQSLREMAANVLLEIEALGGERVVLSEEERRGVQRGLDDVRAGRFASDEDMAALFARYER